MAQWTGSEQPAAHVDVRLDDLLRSHVDERPRRPVRADAHQRHVEGPVPQPDLLVAVEVAGVAAVEDLVPAARDDPRAPERRVAIGEPASREVPRGRRRQCHARDLRLLVPVELLNLRRRDAPLLQVRADAERDEEARAALGERLDRLHVEVIVVVVRDQDRVDARQLVQGDRRLEEAARTDQGRRRHTLAPNRIRQDARSVDLEEDRGVADPRRSQPRLGSGGEVGAVARRDRDRALRVAGLAARHLHA